MSVNATVTLGLQGQQSVISGFNGIGQSLSQLDSASSASAQNLGGVADSVERLSGPLDSVRGGVGDLAGGMGELDQSLGATVGNMEGMVDATEGVNQGLSETGGFVQDAAGGMGELADATETTTGGFETLQTGVEETTTGLETFNTGIDTTNTALDTTTTGLEGVNTGFTDANTVLTDTTAAVEEVNTGFGDTALAMEEAETKTADLSTGMDEVGKKTKDTDTANKGFNNSLTTLGAGITAITGSAVGLFNAYDNIGDSAVAVDAAQIKLDRTVTMLDKKMLSLSNTTRKMNDDSSLMINGLDAWNVAQGELNTLVQQGVTSGSQWDAALQKATVAQQGLTSSTSEGNAVIQNAKIQLDQVSQAAERVAVNQNAVDNANEALNQSYVQVATSVATMAAGVGGLSQSFTGLKGIKTSLIGVSGKLGTAISGLGGFLTGASGSAGILAGSLTILSTAVLGLGVALQGLAAVSAFQSLTIQLDALAKRDVPTALDAFKQLMATLEAVPGLPTGPAFKALREHVEKLAPSITNTTDETNNLKTGMDAILNPLTQVQQSLETQAVQAQKAGEGTAILAGTFTEAGDKAGVLVNGVSVAENEIKRMADGSILYTGAQDLMNASMDEGAVSMENLGGTTGEVVNSQTKLADMNEKVRLSFFTAAAELDDWAAGLITTDAIEKEKIKILRDLAARYGVEIPSSVENTSKALQDYLAQQAGLVTSTKELTGIQKIQAEMNEALGQSYTTATENLNKWAADLIVSKKTEEEEIKILEDLAKRYGITIPDSVERTSDGYKNYLGVKAGLIPVTEAEDEATKKFLETLKDNKKELDEVGKSTYQLTKAVAEGGDEAKAATQQRREDAIALGVYDEMIQLAIGDQDKFVDSKKNESAALKDAAVARGLDTQSTEQNLEVLQTYIQTHERLPPTLKEVEGAYTTLIKTKQDEAFNTELSRQALEKYLVEQMDMPGIVGESIQVLQALDDGLKSLKTAFEEGRAEVINWAFDLAKAQENQKGQRAELELMAQSFINGRDIIFSSNDTLKMWVGILLDSQEAMDKFNSGLDEIWGTIGHGVEEVDKLRQGFLDAGKGIKGSIDQDFEDIKGKFEEFNTMIASGKGIDDFKANFSKGMEDLADDTDMSMQEIETLFGVDLVNALNNPEISDLEFANLWMHRMGEVEGRLTDLTGSIKDFSGQTVATLQAMGPQMGEALATALETGSIEEFKGLFENLPTDVADDLAGVTAELQAGGQSWQEAIGNAMATMKAGMSEEEWNSVFQPMMDKFRQAAADGDVNAQQIVKSFDSLGTGSVPGTQQTVANINTVGPAGTAAREQVAKEVAALILEFDFFGSHTQTIAVNVSGAFSNMAENTGGSILKIATAVDELGNTGFTFLSTTSQKMATTVSGSFSNMSTNTGSSLTSMQSKASSTTSSIVSSFGNVESAASTAAHEVDQLRQAVDRLKDKTITITTVFRTVGSPYAASGASFITESPTKIGPARVSEFSQKEMVTITPLEKPSRELAPGLADLINKADMKKSRRSFDGAMSEPQGVKTVTRTLEKQPIIITMDGREVTKVVSERIFEESDRLV